MLYDFVEVMDIGIKAGPWGDGNTTGIRAMEVWSGECKVSSVTYAATQLIDANVLIAQLNCKPYPRP